MDQKEHLRQLIAAVYQHPDGSREWRIAMNQLLIFLQGLPEFRNYSRPGCPDYFLDALNQTWEWLSRNIRNFQPRTSSTLTDLVKWIRGYLYWRLRDLSSRDNFLPLLDPDQLPGTYSGLDSYLEQQRRQSRQHLVIRLEKYVEQDPDRRLKNCYPRRHPKCNCQILAQRLLFKDPLDRLANIAREYQVKYQTLAWHWKQKAIPLLQSIAIQLGYNPD